MLYANPTPPIHDIVRDLNTADYQWRQHKGLTVMWVGPYTPNLLVHNEIRKQKRGWGNRLLGYEEEAAVHFEEVIEENRKKLIQKMTDNSLIVRQLELLPRHLKPRDGSDGLHLGSHTKKRLFGQVFDAAIQLHQEGAPPREDPGLQLTAEQREVANILRAQKRKRERTRAAEKALFAAAKRQRTGGEGSSKAVK